MTYYRIKNWEKLFENNRTRELKTMAWVPMPNKMDGDGYTQIFEHKNGLEIFAVWVLCVEVASRCDPRGTLLRDGEKTHDFSSLARITRAPRKSFELAIPVLVEIGWLEQLTKNTAGECEITAPSCTEGKGMEGKGMEGNTLSEGDRLISETLAAIITNSKNINITASKITAWAKEIHKLREIDGVPDKRISLALDWYKDHIGEQYTPVIESGSSLREKFIKLEDAMQRSTKHGQPKQHKPASVWELKQCLEAIDERILIVKRPLEYVDFCDQEKKHPSEFREHKQLIKDRANLIKQMAAIK